MESGRDDSERGTVETEVNATKEPVPTEKLLSDDSESRKKNAKNEELANMGKMNEDTEMEDGVQEKMLNEDANIVPAKEPTEVKFISENGDAKIDMETVKKTLSGMGKEELMKYANDPFWIRLRWFLFVCFWFLWIAMLAGAIAIIVMAPKCSAPQPKKSWEESPIVQLDAEEFEKRDDEGVGKLLDNLKDVHVKVASLSHFVGVNGHTTDFLEVQPKIGTIKKFDNIVKMAHDRGLLVVLELDPNHSATDHPWFARSVNRDGQYTDFYVWADSKTGTSGVHEPPNNWLSVNGDSAWEWNDKRGQYYLHQLNKTQPDLNFHNPAVVAEFGKIFNYWLDHGVDGFRLGNTQYLTEDPKLRDELYGSSPGRTDEYGSLSHVYTRDFSENGQVLRQWRDIVKNRTKDEGLFAVRDFVGADVLRVYNEKKTLIDLPPSSLVLKASANVSGSAIFTEVSKTLNSTAWPSWDLNINERSLRKQISKDSADSITLMTLLLPGTPVFKLNDTMSVRDAFVKIAKLRNAQTFLHGEIRQKLINGTVFVYTRIKSGNPGYLVAYNGANDPTTVDLSKMEWVPSELSVFAYSPNYARDNVVPEKLPSNMVPMPANSTLVVTFVPKDE